MPRKLRKLKITHVAICPQGANYDLATGEGAHSLLFKSQDLPDASPDMPPPVSEGEGQSDVAKEDDERCDAEACTDPDCPVHGKDMVKQDATTATDTLPYAQLPLGRATSTRRRTRKRRGADVAKGPIAAMGTHAEPDGDEHVPLDYASRGQQYDLWEDLWCMWECFCTTFYDVIGDGDEDNIPNLPILERSIGQFQADVNALLEPLNLVEKVAPALGELAALVKVGASMAEHRRKRLQDAIHALQQLLSECTPEAIDRPGVCAAEVAGIPGYMKGAEDMAVTVEEVTKRADLAEARIVDLTKALEEATARVKELEPLVAQVGTLEKTIAKMKQTPEEQELEYMASLPDYVRKKLTTEREEMVELRKQLEDAREEREKTSYIAKTADFRGFGMTPGPKHWRILKAIDHMDEEDKDELLRLIKAASEQLKTSVLFKAVGHEGRNGDGTTFESGSASEQLMALTKAYQDVHTCDFLKASEAIAKEHRDLYQKATQERRYASRVSSD